MVCELADVSFVGAGEWFCMVRDKRLGLVAARVVLVLCRGRYVLVGPEAG